MRPEPAQNLAVFRITVPALILISPELRDGVALASMPAAMRVAPEGLAWLPISHGVAVAMQAVAVASALAAIVGLWARPALAALTIAGLYVFAIPQLVGTVTHDMHLFWFTAILAASPCADALAYDARGRVVPGPSVAYAVPLLLVRALLGVIYFFPGFWKLAEQGLDWALGDNLRNQMYWKWLQNSWIPPVRIDRWPGLLHAGGLFVMAFELSFILLMWKRATRWIALVAGLLFHGLGGWLMRIPFISLWGCYTALVPWARGGGGPPRAGRSWPAVVVGGVILAGAAVQGARDRVYAWPFACYPTFQWRAGDAMPDLEVEPAVQQPPRSQRMWGVAWCLAGVTCPVDVERLRAYARTLSLPPGTKSVRFHRVYRSVVPEEHGRVVRRDFLAEISLGN